jgi:hypothetical protein
MSRLCEQYDRDILYDCHSLPSRIERSRAALSLRLNAFGALPTIIRHIETHTGLDKLDLRRAWGKLLNLIEIDIDPAHGGPKSLDDTAGWLNWAKKFAET